MIRIVHAFFALLTLVQVSIAQVATTAPVPETDTISFTLTEHNNIAIQAIINEIDTLTLMLHTAINEVSLTKEATASMSSIKFTAADSVKSWGGTSESRYSPANYLELGAFSWDQVGIWESEHSGHNTDGKFGLNLFAHKVVELNFEEEFIVIHDRLPETIDSYHRVSLVNENGLLFIAGECLFDQELYANKFLIHSGYSGALLLDDDFVAQHKIGDKVETMNESILKDSYGNELKTINALLPSFRLGGVEFTEVPLGFFQGSINRQKISVLGGEVLKRFHIIFDAERSDVYLRSNQLY